MCLQNLTLQCDKGFQHAMAEKSLPALVALLAQYVDESRPFPDEVMGWDVRIFNLGTTTCSPAMR